QRLVARRDRAGARERPPQRPRARLRGRRLDEADAAPRARALRPRPRRGRALREAQRPAAPLHAAPPRSPGGARRRPEAARGGRLAAGRRPRLGRLHDRALREAARPAAPTRQTGLNGTRGPDAALDRRPAGRAGDPRVGLLARRAARGLAAAPPGEATSMSDYT